MMGLRLFSDPGFLATLSLTAGFKDLHNQWRPETTMP
jgi:hypothetical protein